MVYNIRFEGAERCRLPSCDGTCGEEAGLDMQPPKASHFLAYVDINGLGGEEQEPLVIDVGNTAYKRCICENCHREKCWLPEENALIEFKMDYDSTIYSHYCLCECHESFMEEPEEWEDDDWDDPDY